MRKFLSQDIGIRLNTILIIIVGIGSFSFALLVDLGIYLKAKKDLIIKSNNVIELAAISLERPLWEVNQTGMLNIGRAIMLDQDVMAFQVTAKNEEIPIIREFKIQVAGQSIEKLKQIGKYIYKEKKILYGGEHLGDVCIVISSNKTHKIILDTTITIFLQAFILTLIIGLFVRYLAFKIIKEPIDELIKGASELSKQNLDYEIDTSREDQLGSLARSFANMRNAIREKIQLIEKQNRSLEEKIELIEQKNIELQELDRTKDNFLANTSHELRTPLHGIIGLADAILSQKNITRTNEEKRQLSMIVSSGQRLSNLINDLLDFYKIKEQGEKLQKKPVRLQNLMKSLITFSKPMIKNPALKLINQVPLNLAPIYADESRLEQILYNLISNALKFTEQGEIVIGAEVLKDKIRISVKDTGIGIPKEKQKEIFDHFNQIDGAISRKYQGTGLGLSITKKLVELHNGEITVNSEEGRGSCFRVILPIATDISEIGTEENKFYEQPVILGNHLIDAFNLPKTKNSTTPIKAEKILIVDDDPVNLEILNSHLVRAGYQVVLADSGKKALRELEDKKIDLVLLDLMMPMMSGYEVCGIIRERWDLVTLPVIILSAKNQLKDLEEGFKVGANDYLTKPFHAKEVLSRINTHLKAKKTVEYLKENERLSKEINLRKQLEQKLRIAQQRLISILDIEEDAILCLDSEFNLIFFNRGAENMFAYQAEDLLQRKPNLIFPNPEFKQKIIEKTKTNTKEFCQLLIQPSSGIQKQMEAYLSPVTVNNEKLITIILPGENINLEQKKKEFYHQQINKGTVLNISTDFISDEVKIQHERITALEDAMRGIYQMLSENQANATIRSSPVDKATSIPKTNLNELIVKIMNSSLEYWETSTGKTKVELAEESGIWHVRLEGCTYITRTLNRYLKIRTLPKNPRIQEVIRTANYVLEYCPTIKNKKKELKQLLENLKAVEK